MKLYHGSPKEIKILEPRKAKGHNEFQNLKAVFLTNCYLEACLYTIRKSLKNKALFGIRKDRLIIIGNIEPNEDDMFMNLIFQKKN